MQLNKTVKRSYLGLVGCCGVLGLLSVAMLCPISSKKASAENLTTSSAPTTSVSTTQASLFVQSVVSVSLQSGVQFDITPTASGAFGTGSADLTVSTNGSSGYSLYMRTEDGTQNLANTDGNVIGPVSGDVDKNGFGKNTWGYYLGKDTVTDATIFKAVPTNTASAVTSTSIANGSSSDQYNLTFGARIGTDLPTGEYTNNIVVSVIANPQEVTSLSQLTYMQELTKKICGTTPEHVEKQLIDERDGNTYYVTKMKDGNCWMTQNLALDIDGTKVYNGQTQPGVPVYNVDTNEVSLWSGEGNAAGNNNKPKKTETAVPAADTTAGGPPQTDTRSWNLGKYVLTNPAGGDSCTVNTGQIIGEVCPRFVDVSGADWNKNGQTFDAGSTIPESGDLTNFKAYDPVAKTYDPHYLIGNYYQFNTATAGTGAAVTTDGANASSSVCPAGWQLPLSGTMNNETSGSFHYLLDKYNATSGEIGANTIIQPPLAFVRSGFIGIDVGQTIATGYDIRIRSGTSNQSNGGGNYDLYATPKVVRTTDTNWRWFGFSLRCLYWGQ